MKSRSTFAVTALAAAIALAGCNKPADKTDAKADDAKTEAPGAGKQIPGLKDEKEQISYMVGMDIAKMLEPAKDEIDFAITTKAMKDVLEGKKVLLTEEQANEIRETFAQKMQAKKLAEMMADAKKNAAEGTKFLAENGKKPGVVTTASGLQYQVISEGKGPKPGAGDAVKVKYKGTLLDGKEFDSTEAHGGEPAVLPLDRVIPGWAEGIRLMPVGSKYKFWIPSNLGYGEQVPPGAPFPPNATLVFDVELVDIVKGPQG
ncbi:MAG: FKBP-type peptidyl-prolyl cis-trans isomerase [Xanthomonadaceae bacterium]|mgnify:CR=1 FL=1|nr:FKBP-type peptidyl-prolyl cis-trans isomerase [Xanthomonadaceae bacterium]